MSLEALIGMILCVYSIMQELATCRLQPITAYRPIHGICRLPTERVPDWQAWDVAPPISLQLATFIAVVIDLLQVACCVL